MKINFIPDEVVKKASEVNNLEDIEIEVFPVGDQFVWRLSNVWKNLDLLLKVVENCPVTPPSSEFTRSNPFFKQAILNESLIPLTLLMSQFGEEKTTLGRLERTFSSWANIYQHGLIKAPTVSIYPHADTGYDINGTIFVSNLWFHKDWKDQATAFWQTSEDGNSLSSPLFFELQKKYLSENHELTELYNADSFPGVEKVLEVPAKFGTITAYKGNQLHSPVVSYDPNKIRHSWAIAQPYLP